MFVKFVRRLGPAPILQAIVTATELGRFGRVDTRQSNARPMNLDCVVVNDARLSGQVLSERGKHRHGG